MKIWKITCCKECPKIDHIFKMTGLKHNFIICTMMENKGMDNDNKLPEWCPLPNYKEKKNENNKS